MNVLGASVEWAHECAAPAFARARRLRGTKALGLSYERKLAKALPSGARHGQWYVYSVAGRVSYCQPDFLLFGRTELAVLEAKLTDVQGAWEQLEGLYLPVLEKCYSKRPLAVAVVRSLTRLAPSEVVYERLGEALACARSGRGLRPTLHWMGEGRL